MGYLSGSERTEYSLNGLIIVVTVLFFLVFVIGGNFDRTHVHELHRGAASGVRKFSTKSGIGDDQVALWDDGHGLSGLNHSTPNITLSLQTGKGTLLVY
jgi:hypothetical protein